MNVSTTVSNISLNASAALIDPKTGTCHYLQGDQQSFFIGRQETADITIKHPHVSRTHCFIDKNIDDTFTIRDLSSFGTFVNGEKVGKNKSQTLRHRDSISIADLEDFTFIFKINRKINVARERSEAVSSRFKARIVNLDTSYSDEMKKFTQEMIELEWEKSSLKQELQSLVECQDTIEQKSEAEHKLKEMEEKFEQEKENLMGEIQRKISDNIEKETELRIAKNKMEEQYLKERKDLEERCQAEIEKLKERLAESTEKTLEVSQQLKEAKKTLLESELEQFRLHQEKLEVESKLESKIIDLTQESTNKDEAVKVLEQRLYETEQELMKKELAEERMKKEMEDLEEDLQCSICSELFIEPTVLNCGHMFCKNCIDEWKKKKKICPMCRAKITSCVRIFTMDSIIDKNVGLLSDEARIRRGQTIRERKGDQSAIPAKKRKHSQHTPALEAVSSTRHDLYRPHRLQIPVASTSHRIGFYFPPPVLPPNTPDVIRSSIDEDMSDPDPFAWRRDLLAPPRSHTPSDSTVPSVTVAAIDLTHCPVSSGSSMNLHLRGTMRSRTRSSTVTNPAELIDLTSP